MNKIEKGKTALITFGVIVIVLSVVAAIMGVLLVIWGAKTIAVNENIAVGIIEIVGGGLLTILGCVSLGYGVVFVWTGGSLVATKGSLRDDNLAKGTLDTKKCPKCSAVCAKDADTCEVCKEKLL